MHAWRNFDKWTFWSVTLSGNCTVLCQGALWHFNCPRASKTSIILMLRCLVLLHYKFSLFTMFILAWKQRHFICWGMKRSEGNWVKVEIYYLLIYRSCFGTQENTCRQGNFFWLKVVSNFNKRALLVTSRCAPLPLPGNQIWAFKSQVWEALVWRISG